MNIIIAGSRDISERMPYSGNCILSLNYVNFEILNALSNIKGGRGFLKPCKRHLTNRMRMRYKPQAAVLVIVRVHRYPE